MRYVAHTINVFCTTENSDLKLEHQKCGQQLNAVYISTCMDSNVVASKVDQLCVDQYCNNISLLPSEFVDWYRSYYQLA